MSDDRPRSLTEPAYTLEVEPSGRVTLHANAPCTITLYPPTLADARAAFIDALERAGSMPLRGRWG